MTGWIILSLLLSLQGMALSFLLGARWQRGQIEIKREEEQADYDRKRPPGRTRLRSIRIRR